MSNTASIPAGYISVMVEPPGQAIAPNGFPTDPLPPNASRSFLDSMEVRLIVFCDEQKCSKENELDEDDPRSWSWNIYNSSSQPVATVRLVPPPHPPHPNGHTDPKEEPYLKLTRFATLPQERGKGLGKVLMDLALTWAASNPKALGEGWKGMVLVHAQVAVEKMYAKMGFVTDENIDRFDEEGIEHVAMWKRLTM